MGESVGGWVSGLVVAVNIGIIRIRIQTRTIIVKYGQSSETNPLANSILWPKFLINGGSSLIDTKM